MMSENGEKILLALLLHYAQRDFFDGVGRVFINEFKADCEINDETLEKLIATLRETYDIRRYDNILLITLGRRTVDPPDFKAGQKRVPEDIDAETPI